MRRFWKTCIQTERATEIIRKNIERRPAFSLREAFIYIDKNGNGSLMPDEFRDVLAEHSFYATERELSSLMDKFDRDKDGKVSFSEFLEELSPKLR